MEEKVIVVRKVIVVKNQMRRVETKEKVIQDQVMMMRKMETNEKKRQRWIVKSEQGLNLDHVHRLRIALDSTRSNKALPPEVGDRASALKMADEVLKHLIVVGSSVMSGSTTSAATPS
ncbi:hypothetical protein Scep_017188 [Stephania cephalantha]|uniref:Uncharacterized protein n=1 Tax=Stephania cephalantha TaxID=152367 RepID=A0AAP0NVE7_9MAGN